MTREDIEQLFELLAIYRHGDKRLENKTLRAAWLLVLEPYEPADVKRAVADYLRESKFFPDVSDIAIRCPKPSPSVMPEVSRGNFFTNGYQDEADYLAQMNALLQQSRLMERDYVHAGLPHPYEAKKLGWTVETWNERCTATP